MSLHYHTCRIISEYTPMLPMLAVVAFYKTLLYYFLIFLTFMNSASIVNTGLLVEAKVPASEPTSASTCQHLFLPKNVNNKCYVN